MKELFGENRAITCLDLCAAPGGKSLLLSTFLGNEGRLISNEISRTRNAILRENINRWGASNTIVTCNDAADFASFGGYFDCILIDAPCSGEGMFRKDHEARNEWSPGNVEMCSTRQKKILEDVIPALATGGYLVYSTCTFSELENEANCQWLLESGQFEKVSIRVPEQWNISTRNDDAFTMQFLPHLVPGEGFFVSVFRKVSPTNSSREKPMQVFSRLTRDQEKILSQWTGGNSGEGVKTPDDDIFISPFIATELNVFARKLYVTQPGIGAGRFMKQDFVPAHGLALSGLALPYVPIHELDLEEALRYLRGEVYPVTAQSGWTIVTYKERPLGWIKVLANRINNYYPKASRIRMRD
jgi:NOL1/NOP2/fmu family ribosome biogenesis protein